MRVRNYYGTKAKRGKKAEDWEKYRSLRNEVTYMVRQARVKFFEKLGAEAARNVRKLWRELDRIMGHGKKLSIESLRTSEGLVMDQQGVVDVLNKHFSSWVGKSGDQEGKRMNSSISDDSPQLSCDFKFKKIEEEDVLKLLHSLCNTVGSQLSEHLGTRGCLDN